MRMRCIKQASLKIIKVFVQSIAPLATRSHFHLPQKLSRILGWGGGGEGRGIRKVEYRTKRVLQWSALRRPALPPGN